VTSRVEDAIYLTALLELKGVGSKTALRVVRAFPRRSHLEDASRVELRRVLGTKVSELLLTALETEWAGAWGRAQGEVQAELDRQITPLPITDPEYPPLLKLIEDPPPILHVRGDAGVLSHGDTVAVVGTRDPSRSGTSVREGFLHCQWTGQGY
jgi:DNA processing protein